jgi:esterase/lipase superfamily enzyme
MLPLMSATEQSQAPPGGGPPAGSDRAAINVSVFFVTNRRHGNGKSGADTFSGERGEPHYGQCHVEFSPIPVINQLGSNVPFYVPKETNRVSVAKQPDQQLFWGELVSASQRTTSKSVIVFTHGYNYGFKRTCRMAAEMQRALRGKAVVVMMSWPSNGRPGDYLPDLVDVEWSVPFLATFLSNTADRVDGRNVHVLAHSMGSRGVLFALQRLGADSPQRPLINQLVLLAPDFDSQTFVDLLPRLVPLTGNITLYVSSNDTPLKASRQLNGHPRLGEAGEFLTVVEDVETIDVSPVGRYQILGHEYFYFHPRVSADLVTLLSSGARATERPSLRSNKRHGVTYWQMAEGR